MDKVAGEVWVALSETASRKFSENSSIQDQLQSAGLWSFPEAEDEGSKIEEMITYLEEEFPDIESAWKCKLWHNFFSNGAFSNGDWEASSNNF